MKVSWYDSEVLQQTLASGRLTSVTQSTESTFRGSIRVATGGDCQQRLNGNMRLVVDSLTNTHQ